MTKTIKKIILWAVGIFAAKKAVEIIATQRKECVMKAKEAFKDALNKLKQ
jgi:hypothetical protein